MKLAEFLRIVHRAPLIASVQADEGAPCDDPGTIVRLAQSSLQNGVETLRLQGRANIGAVRKATAAPIIGLIKRAYPGSEVYITPTEVEIAELLALGCDIIALDGTARQRPSRDLARLIESVHGRGALAMADVDSLESARFAMGHGADLIGTTLAGYTSDRDATEGPDLDLLRDIVGSVDRPVVAEGRYRERWQIEAALRIGATAVVVGGALNDPVKQTRALTPRSYRGEANVGSVDIGGTWLRFGVFSPDWRLLHVERTANPPNREARLAWIREQISATGVRVVGVGTGGIVDPTTGICWTAKEYLMPDQIGIEFSERTLGVPTVAHGDGHATAWGHACLPEFAGRRVATLALGTGVGCGFVQNGAIWSGRRGEYPRINDLPAADGATCEGLLGGINLTREPTAEQKVNASRALCGAVKALRDLYFPDDIVVAGSVGLSRWLLPTVEELGVWPSSFGADAGLHGAAALALYPSA